LPLGASADRDYNLFAAAYRTIAQEDHLRLEGWPHSLHPGDPLPTIPLWLATDLSLPLNLEESYLSTWESLRIGAQP
jgi:hypothetical protein